MLPSSKVPSRAPAKAVASRAGSSSSVQCFESALTIAGSSDADETVSPVIARKRGFIRKASLDSLRAKDHIEKLSMAAVAEIMPPWFRIQLSWSGCCSGNEPMIAKVFVGTCWFMHANITTLGCWMVGLPLVPDALVLLIVGYVMMLITHATRYRMLRSGLLWSLAKEIDMDGAVLAPLNRQSCVILVSSALEAMVVNSLFIVFGLVMDISHVTQSVGATARIVCWAAFVLNIALYALYHSGFKAVPLLFVATCNLLTLDIDRFHSEVDALFADHIEGVSGTSTDRELCRRLQQHECHLRAKQAAVNDVMGPGLTWFISLLMGLIIVVTILVFRSHGADIPIALYYFYALVILLSFGMMVALLNGAACVGDRWLRLLDDLNTPELCCCTTRVLGVPLAERLQLLRSMGVKVFGCAVTSQTVLNVTVSVGGGLLFTLIGAMLSASR